MRKPCLLLTFIMIIATITGCQAGSTATTSDMNYGFIHADTFRVPLTVEELIAETDELFTGEITDISFWAYKESDGSYVIRTDYEIEIQNAYFGECSGTVSFTAVGGIPGEYLDEQRAVMNEHNMDAIHILEGFIYPELGKTYLFAFAHGETGLARISDEQYIFAINENEVVSDETVPSYKTIMDYLAQMDGDVKE